MQMHEREQKWLKPLICYMYMYKPGPPQFACPVLMQVTLPEEIKLIMIFYNFDLEII
jgi:hypothetical protein